MKILLIRHGKTSGNLDNRYIGRTDEPLCAEGVFELHHIHYQKCDVLVSSPMQRCVQSAEILFPEQQIQICDSFRECDFGDFECKNYAELNGNKDYQHWVDSGGLLPFPNGESPDDFRKRCCDAFLQITAEYSDVDSIAFVVHGGTIMSILSQFAMPQRGFYDWLTANAHGWQCTFEDHIIRITEKL